MDEEKKLTMFEQAFYDYRGAVSSIEQEEAGLRAHDEWVARSRKKIDENIVKKYEALAELKRHMTPEAFAELTGADRFVTP